MSEHETTQQPITEAAAETTPALSFNTRYNFRTIDEKALEALRNDLDSVESKNAAGDEAFEISHDEKRGKLFKRKAVEATLEQPALLHGLPKLVVEAVQELISKFVKARYIDKFLPIGQHDFAFIEAELAKTGGRVARYDISDETWALAGESFRVFMLAKLGDHQVAAQAATRLGEVMKAKFSKNVITKQLSAFDVRLVEKLKANVISWAEWAAVNDTENGADSFADVFSMVTDRLDGFVTTLNEAKIDFSDVL